MTSPSPGKARSLKARRRPLGECVIRLSRLTRAWQDTARPDASRVCSLLASAAVVTALAIPLVGCSGISGVGSCSSALTTGTAGQLPEQGAAPGLAPGSWPVTPPGQSSGGATQHASGGAAQHAVPDSVITLPTGDRVEVSTAAGSSTPAATVQVVARAAGSPGFLRFTWAGDQYVIPYEAVPYLGSVLDPRLFDVSYLAQLEGHSSAIPVQITYSSATVHAALPGVQVTHRSGSGASALITSAHAAKLGQSLGSLWQASTAGGSRVPAGQIPGITRISLAPSGSAPPLPAWPLQAPAGPGQPGSTGSGPAYHTLTLNFTGADGKPATAIGWVQNLASAPLGLAAVNAPVSLPISGAAGPLSLSLPDGTYSIQFAVFTPHPGTYFGVDVAMVVKPQVTVDSDQSITLDARTAVPFKVSLTGTTGTPSPQMGEVNFTRISAVGECTNGNGVGISAEFSFIGSSAFSATPTPAVTEGSIGFDAAEYLQTAGSPPTSYYLVFPDTGIPSSLSYTITPADLTTVHEHVYAPPNTVAECNDANGQQDLDALRLFPAAYFPWGDTMGSGDPGWSVGIAPGSTAGGNQHFFTPPGDDTVYWYTSDPKLTTWQDTFELCTTAFPGQLWRIKPGQQITQTWGRYPLVPEQGGTFPNGGNSIPISVCAACRQDGNFEPEIWPTFAPRDWAFYQNGQLIEDQPYVTSTGGALVDPVTVDLPLSPQPSAYRLDWTKFDALNSNIDPGASTEMDWTFHSSPGDPAATLPPSEKCAPDPSRSCSFVPLLFLDYDLALNYSEQAVAGQPFTIAFTVAHQPGEAPPAGVTATVSASFNDGKTWTTPQRAAGQGNNRFAATISQPPLASTTGYASLRITAADNAGNSVTQTVIEAYHLTS
jgi:hypothetical protein